MSTSIADHLPPLTPGARRDVAARILKLVAEHDGDWYWYQIDLSLSREQHTGPFVNEISALISTGLIIAAPTPKPGGVRYHLSETARSLFSDHIA